MRHGAWHATRACVHKCQRRSSDIWHWSRRALYGPSLHAPISGMVMTSVAMTSETACRSRHSCTWGSSDRKGKHLSSIRLWYSESIRESAVHLPTITVCATRSGRQRSVSTDEQPGCESERGLTGGHDGEEEVRLVRDLDHHHGQREGQPRQPAEERRRACKPGDTEERKGLVTQAASQSPQSWCYTGARDGDTSSSLSLCMDAVPISANAPGSTHCHVSELLMPTMSVTPTPTMRPIIAARHTRRVAVSQCQSKQKTRCVCGAGVQRPVEQQAGGGGGADMDVRADVGVTACMLSECVWGRTSDEQCGDHGTEGGGHAGRVAAEGEVHDQQREERAVVELHHREHRAEASHQQ